MPVPSEIPFLELLTFKGVLEPSTSLKGAIRELKHGEQNRNPGAYLDKASPMCSRPQSSIEVDAERTDLDIVFVDQILDFTLQLTPVLDAGWRGVDLDCCRATMATNADLALTEMRVQDPLSMRLRCAAIAISPNVSTTFILLMPARIQRLLSAGAPKGDFGVGVGGPPPKSRLQARA